MNNEHIIIILTLSAILFISPYISSLIRLPTAPVEIILGSIGSYFLALNPQNHYFYVIGEMGFFYLMFLAGTEVNLNMLLKLDIKVFKNGLLYLGVLYATSAFVVILFGFSKIFIFMFSLISVGLIMSLFKEYGKDKEWLNLSMNVGVLGELLSIVLLTITAAFLEHGVTKEMFHSIGLLIAFIFAILLFFKLLKILFWWHPEWKVYLVPKYGDKDEKDIRTSMALFFFMVAIMYILHLETAFGAFIAGIFIATFFEHKEELPHKLGTFGFGLLIPIFFVHVGSTFKLEKLQDFTLVKSAILVTFIMIAIRFISSTVFYKELDIKQRALFSLAHSMPLTLLIAIATLSYESKTINEQNYYILILASLFEVIISMVAIKSINQLPSGTKTS